KKKDDGDVIRNEADREEELETGLQTVGAEAPVAEAAPAQPAQPQPQPPQAGQPQQGQPQPGQPQAPKDLTKLNVQKSCSRSLAGWLGMNRVSLAITSYQTGRIYLVG